MRAIKQGSNKFCVPAVLSIATGKSTDECAAAISKVTGQYTVKAVAMTDAIKAAALMRVKIEEIQIFQGWSIYSTITYLYEKEKGSFIFATRDHVVAVEITDSGVYLCDNHTKEPIDAAVSARLGQTVSNVYRVKPRPDPKLVKECIQIIHEDWPNGAVALDCRVIREFEDPEDNETVTAGYLKFKDATQMMEFVRQLDYKVDTEY